MTTAARLTLLMDDAQNTDITQRAQALKVCSGSAPTLRPVPFFEHP